MKKAGLLLFCLLITLQVQPQAVVTYTPTEDIIANPERGFYAHMESFNGGNLLNKNNLVSLREQNGVTLILMMNYLKKFIDAPLSDEVLANVEANFNIMREAGVKCVLRYAYKSSENDRPWDPTVEMTQTHITQLAPIIYRNSDVIAVMETGFVGVWGEWYYSTNFGFPAADFEKRNTVVDALLNALPERRMIQLRTPKLKFGICGITSDDALTEDEAYNGSKKARIGHHNDCFLANASDYGTYGNLAVEKAFLEQDTKYLPMGGETCNPSEYSGCMNALVEMERFHWSYLNKDYHRTVLNNWDAIGCMEVVKKKLGYRFVLETGTYTGSARPGGCFTVKISLTNQGWAAPYNMRDVELILVKEDGSEKYWIRLPENPQFWMHLQPVTIDRQIGLPSTISEGTYHVYLNLPDPEVNLFSRPEYSIRLANGGTWDAATGYNDLNTDLVVSASAPESTCTGDLTFLSFPRVPHLDQLTVVQNIPLERNDRIYPNPVSYNQTLVAEFDSDRYDSARMTITSITGQVVDTRSLQVTQGHNRILLTSPESATPGIYILSINGSNRYLLKKLTVQQQ
ncbi:MAG: DUF4832 domain-containing protein [Bacteroidota bacterium]